MGATTHPAWVPAPARPRIAEREVHVWRADLATLGEADGGAAQARLDGLLSTQERARAARYARARDGRLWAAARGVLRELLGRYTESDPRALRFATTGRHGKPALAGAALCFNLAHSGGLALYAVGDASNAVGVDVERGRPQIDAVALAGRVFGPGEAQRLQALDPEARRREFLRAWVRHEARLKCRGAGLFAAQGQPREGELGERELGVGELGERELPERGPRECEPQEPLWIAELEVAPEIPGAVAAAQAPRELLCWEYALPGGAAEPRRG
ncbi:MAG TPA: 4'-phosphopantetheinyl transferase superfamily protein [Solirubrobacteraceae bacterium]|jgi:4'-phosphopantetheinyl transferase